MKRTLSLILAALTALAVLAVFPVNAEVDREYSLLENAVTSGDWTYVPNSDGATASVIRYNGPATEVAIPGEIDGHTVTRIAWADDGDLHGVFDTTVEKVTIPESVTTIGVGAFAWAQGLTEITIPGSVTKLEEYAFDNCTSLKSITIPDSVTDLGYQTFEYCTSLESVVIGDAVPSLGPYIFYGCTALTKVTVGKGVRWIGLCAFKECTALRNIEFSEGIEEITDDSFNGCTALESVSIPLSVTKIRHGAFYDCSALAKVYYAGSEEDWNKIEIEDYNDELLAAKIVFPGSEADAATGDTDETTAPAAGVKTAPQTGDVTAAVVVLLFATLYISALTIAKKKKER